jgi:RimJ/RimL family protein N-acetyltransferase
MYELKEALTIEEKQTVANAMSGAGRALSNIKVWGYWDKDKCVGGINLYNINQSVGADNFSIGFDVAPNFKLGFVIYASTRAALNIVPRLIAKVELKNVRSRKGAKQLGFRTVYFDADHEFLELYTISDKLHKRWKNYV